MELVVRHILRYVRTELMVSRHLLDGIIVIYETPHLIGIQIYDKYSYGIIMWKSDYICWFYAYDIVSYSILEFVSYLSVSGVYVLGNYSYPNG
jgi:hypothetical protein